MASEDHYKHAILLYARLKAEAGDYPHWNGLHIYDMIKEGVSDEHIEAEWKYALSVHQDFKSEAAEVLSRLRRLSVDRSHISEYLIALWMNEGVPERTMALQYLLTTLAPTTEDPKACLTELEDQMGPCPSMTEEYILSCIHKGTPGVELTGEYARRVYEAQLAEQVDFADPMSDEDLWFELHFGLLYATTKLPSAPIVLRHPERSLDQYNMYFNDSSGIDMSLFNAKTDRLAVKTAMNLHWRVNLFIREGDHPKALRTTITAEHLEAYRKIRDNVIDDESNLDVESHGALWQFLMDLAAELHPDPPSPQDPERGPMPSTHVAKPTTGSRPRWTTAERSALWRCINRWCNKNGVDQFELHKFKKAKCIEFAEEIKADCAEKGEVSNRSPTSVYNQIKDAHRKDDPTVPNWRITDLFNRAEEMREIIARGDHVSKKERRPKAAIKVPGDDESEDGLEGSDTDED
ncbi:hypothetical protein J4E83_004384 [Alternaria metachromatica]|uniref:uncharacterized protein n=1 Tax=Alternaria metachromatica TaxID=283354 RepID=UPI0020C50DD8|nr:uncharacterized protein J4E83_004384 [Alternaria metachromatica]KAI4624708.1 hypothetical protein J4E83_004384 [Alternaria metachromatica]